jgi:6-phosphogluconate dehydrogenase
MLLYLIGLAPLRRFLVNFESFLNHRSTSLRHMLDLIVNMVKIAGSGGGKLDSGIKMSTAISQPVAAVFARKISNDHKRKCAPTDKISISL